MVPVTRFTSLAAVEAWDSRYRWRQDGRSRDASIDATWRRVADAVAAAEGSMAPLWAHRFVTAFNRWQLLPDERLLRVAGTDVAYRGLSDPAAAINVAAFVSGDGMGMPCFDRSRLVETAALATRFLDDALVCYGSDNVGSLRVGLVGLADAFRMLEMPYGSEAARQFAMTVATLLAEGSLRGNIDLAAERGGMNGPSARDSFADRMRRRRMPAPLIAEVLKQGVRHPQVTALDPHPGLALLANDAADALDPLPGDAMRGYDEQGNCTLVAHARLIAALQPCIDQEIRPSHTRLDGGPAWIPASRGQDRTITRR
ncbi:hypothetical protein [Pseudoxanthomonas sp. SE1]|uniref:hypothetical protein n=1 Tax=Pseudoxanthomonas sp. SE1 TaxID=1664560 RepID=UPI00240E4940|nr:hypothetical protein [Pseudoxanthomonas sp. SE1]WFC41555.1 hypothetical protein OY559_17490 [Pseudoxanthomonas sp. SE1]